MQWICHYSICAVFISGIVCVFYYYRKNYPSFSGLVYGILLLTSLFSAIFDTISIYTLSFPYSIPVWLNYIINIIYLLCFNATGIIYHIYVLSVSRPHTPFLRRDKILLLVLSLADIFLIATTPFTHWIIYFDENRVYCDGPLKIILFLTAFFVLFRSLYITIRYRKCLSKVQILSVYFFTIANIIAVIIQLLNPVILIADFTVSLATLLIYLALQNPDDYIDHLVQTFNQEAFIKTVSSRLEADEAFTLLCIELDDFKFINETLGIANGNNLLCSVASFLKKETSLYQVYRLEGVRFSILLSYKDPQADALLEAIQKRFSVPFETEGVEVTLTPLTCCIHCPEHASCTEDVLDAIDYSLAEAKVIGKEQTVYADEDTLARKKRDDAIQHILKRAIKNEEFEVYYQPIYSPYDRQFISAEALIRLNDPELGFISPDEFIPIAEQNGTILQIGKLVFEKVCQMISSSEIWKFGIHYIEVNLSTVQCMQEGLAQELIQIMDQYHVPYFMINLEITETAAYHSREQLLSNMKQLIDKGVSFSLDDYGTGFANMDYIVSFPFKIIKIDKSIVWSAMKTRRAGIVFQHIVQLIKDLNLEIVAEGVETIGHVNVLSAAGVNFLQGYYYSRPVPEETFLGIIKNQ